MQVQGQEGTPERLYLCSLPRGSLPTALGGTHVYLEIPTCIQRVCQEGFCSGLLGFWKDINTYAPSASVYTRKGCNDNRFKFYWFSLGVTLLWSSVLCASEQITHWLYFCQSLMFSNILSWPFCVSLWDIFERSFFLVFICMFLERCFLCFLKWEKRLCNGFLLTSWKWFRIYSCHWKKCFN